MNSIDPRKELKYVTNNKLVGKHLIDNKITPDTTTKKTAVFIILSIMIHTGVVAFILYTNMDAEPIVQPQSIKTSLVTSEELILLQNQIQLNQTQEQLNASNGANNSPAIATTNMEKKGNSNSVAVDISSQGKQLAENSHKQVTETEKTHTIEPDNIVFTPSKEMQEINAQIEEQDRQFAQELQSFEQTETEKITSKVEQKEREEQEQRERELRKVDELRANARPPEEITAENQNDLEEAAALLDEINAARNVTSDMTNTQNLYTEPQSKNSTSNTQNLYTEKPHSENRAAAIEAKIVSYFVMPSNSKGTKTNVTIFVDKRGYVTQVVAKGENTALNNAAEQAVLAAKILPIDPTDPRTYPSFSIVLRGKT